MIRTRLFKRLQSEFQECADEGVRLGIGGAIRRVEQLYDEEESYDGREALSTALYELRVMSVAYGEAGKL